MNLLFLLILFFTPVSLFSAPAAPVAPNPAVPNLVDPPADPREERVPLTHFFWISNRDDGIVRTPITAFRHEFEAAQVAITTALENYVHAREGYAVLLGQKINDVLYQDIMLERLVVAIREQRVDEIRALDYYLTQLGHGEFIFRSLFTMWSTTRLQEDLVATFNTLQGNPALFTWWIRALNDGAFTRIKKADITNFIHDVEILRTEARLLQAPGEVVAPPSHTDFFVRTVVIGQIAVGVSAYFYLFYWLRQSEALLHNPLRWGSWRADMALAEIQKEPETSLLEELVALAAHRCAPSREADHCFLMRGMLRELNQEITLYEWYLDKAGVCSSLGVATLFGIEQSYIQGMKQELERLVYVRQVITDHIVDEKMRPYVGKKTNK